MEQRFLKHSSRDVLDSVTNTDVYEYIQICTRVHKYRFTEYTFHPISLLLIWNLELRSRRHHSTNKCIVNRFPDNFLPFLREVTHWFASLHKRYHQLFVKQPNRRLSHFYPTVELVSNEKNRTRGILQDNRAWP